MDCNMPGLPVLYHFQELAQTHVHWLTDAIKPSHPLSPPSPPAFSLSHRQCLPISQLFTSGGQSIGASASLSVLLMHIQGCFHLGLIGLISPLSKGLSRVFSSTTIRKHQFFGVQPPLWSNTQISTRLLENHSFDYMDLCWQSNVSTF